MMILHVVLPKICYWLSARCLSWRAFLGSLWLSLAVAVPSYAGDKQLSIAVGSWPPFLAQSQQHSGHVAHLIKDVFQSRGYIVSFQFMPWERAYREAAAGKHDATAVWMDKQERRLDFLYSDAVMDEVFVFFHRSRDPFDWQTYSDLSQKKIGGGLSYSYGEEMDKAIDQGTILLQRVSTTEQNIKRLAAGFIDAFAEEQSVGYFHLRQLSHLQGIISHHPKPVSVNQSYVLFPRGTVNSQVLIKEFNQGLADFRSTGKYQQYFDDFSAGKYDPPASEK